MSFADLSKHVRDISIKAYSEGYKELQTVVEPTPERREDTEFLGATHVAHTDHTALVVMVSFARTMIQQGLPA